jgi:hypothetical protein
MTSGAKKKTCLPNTCCLDHNNFKRKGCSKFGAISLLNCNYKIFTKVLTNRIGLVTDRLISTNQIAFIKGRYILESVMTAHEILHKVHQNKQQRFVLKSNYEKAYDKVNWAFLLEVLEKIGFGRRWIELIKRILHMGSIRVTVNNIEGGFFQTCKGLIVDVLTRML